MTETQAITERVCERYDEPVIANLGRLAAQAELAAANYSADQWEYQQLMREAEYYRQAQLTAMGKSYPHADVLQPRMSDNWRKAGSRLMALAVTIAALWLVVIPVITIIVRNLHGMSALLAILFTPAALALLVLGAIAIKGVFRPEW